MKIEEKIWVTYGIDEISPEKFNKISQDPNKYRPINKPWGGLWTSPKNKRGTTAWYDWCESEDFCVGSLRKSVEFKLKPDTRLYIINGLSDLEELMKVYKRIRSKVTFNLEIDFERLENDGYDGVYLTEIGQIDTRYSYPLDLNGWDVESAVLFNLDCIEKIG